MSKKLARRSPRRSSIKKQNNPQESYITKLFAQAAPIATAYGVSRVGSRVISTPIMQRVSNPFLLRVLPVFISASFVGIAYGVTHFEALSKYRMGAMVGTTVNAILTLTAAIFPSVKPLMALAGYDYSHVPTVKVPDPRLPPQLPTNNTKALVSIESSKDEEDDDDDLKSGMFAESDSWAF